MRRSVTRRSEPSVTLHGSVATTFIGWLLFTDHYVFYLGGVGRGCGVGRGLGVTLGVALGVGLAVGVPVGVGLTVALGVGVGVGPCPPVLRIAPKPPTAVPVFVSVKETL